MSELYNMKKILFLMPKYVFRWLVRNNHHFVIALFYKIFAIKVKRDGSNFQAVVSGKITILAINADRFRGDLECLAQVNRFRVLTLDGKWGRTLMVAFTRKEIDVAEYINARAGDDIYNLKQRMNVFFSGFTSSLLKLIKVDCVITVSYRYMEDFHWVKSFTKKGIPHLCFYREGLLAFDRAYDKVTLRHRLFNNYPVTHVVVHNQKCKSSFVESGFVTEGQVSVHGALRMDNLLKQINAGNGELNSKDKNRRKKVTLFYFPFQMSLFGKEGQPEIIKMKYPYAEIIWPHCIDMFRDLHISLIRLAQKHTDIDFVIKPKQLYVDRNHSWSEYLEIVNETGIDLSKLKNYTIEPIANVHKLIINSDVVIALQSSTVLEAAIAGKPVIFPLFYNYKETKNFNDFMWRDHLDLFDVAESADELETLVVERLENPKIDKKIMESRRELFKEYFSDLEGVALKKYTETIENIVTSAKLEAR